MAPVGSERAGQCQAGQGVHLVDCLPIAAVVFAAAAVAAGGAAARRGNSAAAAT